MRGPWDLPAILKLRALLKSQRTDILHTHSSVDGWVGGMAARWAGVASLRTRHLSAKVPNHPFNIVYRLPQAVVTTGESIRRHLVDDYGLSSERVVSIPTGIDVERYADREPEPGLARELGLKPRRAGGGYSGHPALLEAPRPFSWPWPNSSWTRAAEAQFLIVGGGPKEQEVRGLGGAEPGSGRAGGDDRHAPGRGASFAPVRCMRVGQRQERGRAPGGVAADGRQAPGGGRPGR